LFDHEKLDVYGVELEFVAWTTDFFADACESPALHKREILDQLDRASLSAFSIRRRETVSDRDFNELSLSMMPEARLLNARLASTLPSAKRIASEDRIRPGKEMLVCIVAMLTRLVDRFDVNEYRIREDPSVL
jgi:hypothetical protein